MDEHHVQQYKKSDVYVLACPRHSDSLVNIALVQKWFEHFSVTRIGRKKEECCNHQCPISWSSTSHHGLRSLANPNKCAGINKLQESYNK